jgi:hypothetical protein
MKKILTIVLVFISVICNAQNINKLDEQRGFKDIKIGDLKIKWIDWLTYDQTKEGVSSYRFNLEKCCNTIFDMKIEVLTLLFKNDKIVGIEIIPEKIQKGSNENEPTRIEIGFQKYENFISNFSSLFGNPTGQSSPQNKGVPVRRAQWLGKNVFLQLDYNYYGVLNGDRLQVDLWDMTFVKSSISSGF